MDAEGEPAVRRFVEAASPDFPVVLDRHHRLGELFGVVNVPSGIWVDESGVLVRPPETAYPARPRFAQIDPDDPAVQARMPAHELARLRTVIPQVARMRIEPEAYVAALRDWVRRGAASRYALPPDEVVERSRPRPRSQAEAAAAFELASALRERGAEEAAVRWFRESHRLQPENWTYKRQAWSLVDRAQGPTEQYDGDWLSDVDAIGAEHYYEPVRLD